MIRRHDRYLLKAFWATFAAVVLFFTVISVVLDVSDRLSRVSRNWDRIEATTGEAPGLVMVKFYLTLIPFIWLRMLPFCVPMAAAFCLSRLARHRELTPLLVTGVSLRRILLPLVISGVVVAGGMLAARAWVVPKLSRTHMKLARILSRSEPDRIVRVPHFHDPSGGRVSSASFNPLQRRLEKVTVTFRDDDGAVEALHWYPALEWRSETLQWVAPDGGQIMTMQPGAALPDRRIVGGGHVSPLTAPSSLFEITLTRSRSAGLSFAESQELIRANPGNARFVTLHQELFTVPLSTLVLLLLALPFCVPLGARSAIPGMLAGMAMAALFFAASYLFASLGSSGELNPTLMAWMPTAVFGALGLALYLGMEA